MKKMIKHTVFGLAIAGPVFFSACNRQQQDNTDEQLESAAPRENSFAAAPAFSDPEFTAIYSRYIDLKDALVASDPEGARTAAGALQAALKKMPGTEKAVRAAAGIKEAPDMSEQRSSFSELSDIIATLAKTSGMTSGVVYLAFCPMANDNAGAYWLASEKEIKNPYFGDKMLKCGEVKETIN